MADGISDYHLERIRLPSNDAIPMIIPMRFGANTIGRLPSNNIVLSSIYASRRHCTIYVTETDQITVKNNAVSDIEFIALGNSNYQNNKPKKHFRQQTEYTSMANKKKIKTSRSV